jgi:hypothetical protein
MWPTRPANPVHGGQTVLKCCEPTIRGTGAAEIVFGTPRMVLGRGGFFKADDSRKHSNRSAKNQL